MRRAREERPLGAPYDNVRYRPSCQALMSALWGSGPVQRDFEASWLWCDTPALCETRMMCAQHVQRAMRVAFARRAVADLRLGSLSARRAWPARATNFT